MQIVDRILPVGEFYSEVYEKDTIYLHHTAGGHRPDWTIDGWRFDRTKKGGLLAVGTAYVIGGQSTNNPGDSSWDGTIYRAFDDKFWAHHLGTTLQNNGTLNRKSIGIEICNYGPLIKTAEGLFLNYVKKPVPSNHVVELEKPWRNFQFWHKYTQKQLDAVKWLIADIVKRHPKVNIDGGIRYFLNTGTAAYDKNGGAEKGVPGIWSHSNVRSDKTDVSPQPQLNEMLKEL